ncbi:retention module-containing protein, partial [Thiomicrorhabdus sp. Milos-T2]|uniref:retention module-containing protein n=1 Tax=Thiomicrorhabdus sp. Milos-T2 TaxID=90814 RepID=UPI0004943C3E
MSTIVGEVAKLEGIVRAINPVTGEVRILEPGSPVFAGEIIQTSDKGGVVVGMVNGTLLTLGRDTQMRLDDDVSGQASTVDSGTEGAVDIAALQQAILEGNFDALEATAAGDAFVIGSASDGGVFVERIGLEGQVTSGFDTNTEEQVFNENPRFVGEELNEPVELATLSINDVTVNEDAGTMTFTVSLSAPTESPVTFSYASAENGSATSDVDYDAVTGNGSIAGTTDNLTTTITVPINDDYLKEGDETFLMNLTPTSGNVDAANSDLQGVGTIEDAGSTTPEDPETPLTNVDTVYARLVSDDS